MTFHIITIFPKIFDSYFNESIIKRAREQGKIAIKIHNLRDWATDRHRSVDDSPYGGGPGMVMRADIIYRALKNIKLQITNYKLQINSKYQIKNSKSATSYQLPATRSILFSAKGKPWNQQLARQYAKFENIIMVCGRYEGVDERVKKFTDEEISVGPYVLSGGEIPAMAVVDSITRLLPGVLGNPESLNEESHTIPATGYTLHDTQLEYPQYTRPEILEINGKKHRVPKMLLSGNHQKIAAWRRGKIKNRNQK